MKVRALGGFCTGGGRDVVKGEEFEAPPHMVREWLTIGHVELVDSEAAMPPDGLTVGRLYNQHGEVWNFDPAAKGK